MSHVVIRLELGTLSLRESLISKALFSVFLELCPVAEEATQTQMPLVGSGATPLVGSGAMSQQRLGGSAPRNF